jgi:rubrerythrin
MRKKYGKEIFNDLVIWLGDQARTIKAATEAIPEDEKLRMQVLDVVADYAALEDLRSMPQTEEGESGRAGDSSAAEEVIASKDAEIERLKKELEELKNKEEEDMTLALKYRCNRCGQHAKPAYFLHDSFVQLCRSCYFEAIDRARWGFLQPKKAIQS